MTKYQRIRRPSGFRRTPAGLIMVFSLAAAAAPASATDLLIVEVETQQVDLDAATVVTPGLEDVLGVPGADIKLSYHADRSPHAVVVPASNFVGIAFVADVGFDGVSAQDVANLTFSPEPVDLAFTASDCVVIRTDQGAVYKIGNASESGLLVSFNFSAL